jgi:hypothetical protein
MSAPVASGGVNAEDVQSLRSAIAELCEELKGLNRRVDGLSAAIERLDSADSPTDVVETEPEAEEVPPPRPAAPAATTRVKLERRAVVVRPLPELAMAAMAETSLRDLPGVSEVVSSERVDDWARFTLEVAEGSDLIAEMKQGMPVAFSVIETGPEEISIKLRWAWGASD